MFDNDTIATRYFESIGGPSISLLLANIRSTWLITWIGGRLKRVTESIELMVMQPADADAIACI